MLRGGCRLAPNTISLSFARPWIFAYGGGSFDSYLNTEWAFKHLHVSENPITENKIAVKICI